MNMQRFSCCPSVTLLFDNSLFLRCFILEYHVSKMILVEILTDATGVAHIYISEGWGC